MKRFAKIILGAFGALVVVLIVVLVGINLYLQSGDVQQRIRLATEQALGTPVTVKETLYTPWNGLTLSGLSLPDPTIPGDNLAEAPKFSVQFQFFSLLSRKLVISSISLSSPHLVLRQNADKKWVFIPPRLPHPEKPAAGGPVATIHAPAYSVELRNFYISDGTVEIIDNRGTHLATVSGLGLDGSLSAAHRIEGNLWIDTIDIGTQLHPNRLRARFAYENELLNVSDLKCALADGRLRGEFTVALPHKGTPAFQLKTDVEDVSIATLISEAHGDDKGASGTLLGNLVIRGNPLDSSTLVGEGQISLDSAQLRPFDMIQTIGTILRVDELQMLKLHEASMHFDIGDQKFQISDLTLKTDNLIITGKGPVKFNGKMNFDGRFLVNEKIQHELSMFIGDQFTPSAEPGYKEVSFTIDGHIDRPKTNLLDKITGYHIGNIGPIGSMLKGLFSVPSPVTPPPAQPAPLGTPSGTTTSE